MDDIIFTQPWACGDKDCKAQWHQRAFWAYSDGTFTVDEYSDGYHEGCDESDLPSSDEVAASWRAYAHHVIETGEDPLGEYMVNRHRIETQSWAFRFNRSIVGPVLIQARRGRTTVPACELPEHVRAFLGLMPDHKRIKGFSAWDEFAQAVPGVKPGQWFRSNIEHKAPRSPAHVSRDLRAAARRHLRVAAKTA